MSLPLMLMAILPVAILYLGWWVTPVCLEDDELENEHSTIALIYLMLLWLTLTVILAGFALMALRFLFEWYFASVSTEAFMLRNDAGAGMLHAVAVAPSVCCAWALAYRGLWLWFGRPLTANRTDPWALRWVYLFFAVPALLLSLLMVHCSVYHVRFEEEHIVEVKFGVRSRCHYADITQVIATTHALRSKTREPYGSPKWTIRFANWHQISTEHFPQTTQHRWRYEEMAVWVAEKRGTHVIRVPLLESVPWP